MLVPARHFVLLWLLSRETALWLPGNEKPDLKWKYAFWEYARQIGHRPCAGLCEADFALIAHNDYHLLLNQEAMSAKWLTPYIYLTLPLVLKWHLCPFSNQHLAGSLKEGSVSAYLPLRRLWEAICLTAHLAGVESSLSGMISHWFCHTKWC